MVQRDAVKRDFGHRKNEFLPRQCYEIGGDSRGSCISSYGRRIRECAFRNWVLSVLIADLANMVHRLHLQHEVEDQYGDLV
jgi:hypothetical protein